VESISTLNDLTDSNIVATFKQLSNNASWRLKEFISNVYPVTQKGILGGSNDPSLAITCNLILCGDNTQSAWLKYNFAKHQIWMKQLP